MIITKNAVKITPYSSIRGMGPAIRRPDSQLAFPQTTRAGPGLWLSTPQCGHSLSLCHAPRWTGNIRFGLQVCSCRVWWTWSPGTCWAFKSWVLPARVSGFGPQLVLTSPRWWLLRCGTTHRWAVPAPAASTSADTGLPRPSSPLHVLFLTLYLRSCQSSWESILFFLSLRFWLILAFHDIIVSGVRATIHRSTLFVETWKKVFWK